MPRYKTLEELDAAVMGGDASVEALDMELTGEEPFQSPKPAPAPPPKYDPVVPGMGRMEQFTTGLGSGAYGLGLGLGQRAAELSEFMGQEPDISSAEYRRMEAERRAAANMLKQERGGQAGFGNLASWGEFGGETLPFMMAPVTRLTSMVNRGISTIPSVVGRNALLGATSGGAAGYVAPRANDESVLANTALGAGLGGALGVVAPQVGRYAKDVYQKAVHPEKFVDTAIDRGVFKGLKPDTPKKLPQFRSQQRVYRDGVKAIVENKDAIALTDELGNEVKGRLPQNLVEFGEAVTKTKRLLFDRYDQMMRDANADSPGIRGRTLANELRKIVGDVASRDFDKEAINQALEYIIKMRSRGTYRLSDIQNAIEILNQRLYTHYKTGNWAGGHRVAEKLVSKMRSELDTAIERLEGPGYQELKKQYGAVKALEENVGRAIGKDMKKNPKAFPDYFDAYSAGRILAHTGDPNIIAGALVAQGVKKWYGHMNDPNRIIRKMFDYAGKHYNPPLRAKGGRIFDPEMSPPGARRDPGTYDAEFEVIPGIPGGRRPKMLGEEPPPGPEPMGQLPSGPPGGPLILGMGRPAPPKSPSALPPGPAGPMGLPAPPPGPKGLPAGTPGRPLTAEGGAIPAKTGPIPLGTGNSVKRVTREDLPKLSGKMSPKEVIAKVKKAKKSKKTGGDSEWR